MKQDLVKTLRKVHPALYIVLGLSVLVVWFGLGRESIRVVRTEAPDSTGLVVETHNSFFESLYRGPWSQSNFELVGTMSSDAGNVTQHSVLPVYSRPNPTHRGRNLYFTKTESYNNSLPVAIHANGRSCMSSLGCDYLSAGDSISVPQVSDDPWILSLYNKE